MKKGIIFLDFNGVISHNRYRSRLSKTHKLEYESIQKTIFLGKHNLAQRRMKGELYYYDIINIIHKKNGVPIDTLETILREDCQNMDINLDLVNYISQPDYYLILMTDNMDCFDKRTSPDLFNLGIFKEIWSSSKAGYLKTDFGGKAFIEIAHKYDIAIKDCYLIDDSSKNCSLFNIIGGNSIHFTTKESFFNTTFLK